MDTTGKNSFDPLALACDLIRIPSESSDPVGTTPGCEEQQMGLALDNYFRRHNIPVSREKVTAERYNVVARLPQEHKPRLLIVAHMDTVSGKNMADPFTPVVSHGHLHGRGACDNKGPLAAAASAIARIKTESLSPQWDITFLGSVDEEATMAGAHAFAEKGESFDFILVLEPTGMNLVHAHKGCYRCILRTSGKAAHSAFPESGTNAINRMTPVLQALEELATSLAQRKKDPLLGTPTLATTQIHGGTGINTVPDTCTISLDTRLPPDITPSGMERLIREQAGDETELQQLFSLPAMHSDAGNETMETFRKTIEAGIGHCQVEAVHYATEGAILAELGPCFVWGPGDISYAHSRDEQIKIEEITTAQQLLAHFLTNGNQSQHS